MSDSSGRRFHDRALQALALVALLVLLYIPGLLTGRILCFRDNLSHHLGWRLAAAGRMAAGELPLVDPVMGGGAPLLADPNTMVLYPTTALFFVLPPALALTLHYLLHQLLLGLGGFLLLRRLGRGPLPALVGATFLAGGGLAFSQLAFTNAAAALAWAPWIAWTAAGRSVPAGDLRRRVALGGLFGALSLLAGEPVITLLSWMLWAVVLLSGGVGGNREHPGRRAGLLAAPLLALLLAAPVLLPAAAIRAESRRHVIGLPEGSAGADAFRPLRWPELLLPHLHGAPGPFAPDGFWARPTFGWLRYEVNLHLGTLALVLVFMGMRGRKSRIWTVTTAGAAFLAASAGLLERLAQVVPAAGELRYVIKFLLLAHLALAPLVARGAVEALRHRKRFRRVSAGAAAVLLVLAVPLSTPGGARRLLSRLAPASRANLEAPGVARSVAASVRRDLATGLLPLAAAAVAPRLLLLPALALQLAAGGASMLIWDTPGPYLEPPPLASRLGDDTRVLEAVGFRFDTLHTSGDPELAAPVRRARLGAAQLWRYYGGLHGLRYRGAVGPDGMEPWWVADAARRLRASPPAAVAHAARHLGAAWILHHEELPGSPDVTATESLEVLGEPVVLHRLARPVPAAWLAAREITAASRDAGWQLLLDPSVEPGRDAVTPGRVPGLRNRGGGTVTVELRRPDRWRLVTRVAGEGLLVLDQAYSDLWRVTVDGHDVEPVLVNLWQLGIRVPAGEHRIEAWWSRGPFARGVLLAIPGLALTLLLLVLPSRGRRPPTGGEVPTRREGPGMP